MASANQRQNKAKRRRQQAAAVKRSPRPASTDVLADLLTLKAEGYLVLDAEPGRVKNVNLPACKVRLDLSAIAGVPTGLQIGTEETVYIAVDGDYPNRPPVVLVDPEPRYLGYPHVIRGQALCIYLDPGREWNPAYSMRHVLTRTVEWFDNAANDRFDPRTSLFHAVGGAAPTTASIPMIVMRDTFPNDLKPITTTVLAARTPRRLDLVRWRDQPTGPRERRAVTIRVPRSLPYGLDRTVGHIAAQIEDAGGPTIGRVIDRIQTAALNGNDGDATYFALIVEHPTEPDLPAVVFGLIPGRYSDELRSPFNTLKPATTPIEWIPVSDERPTTTRRDSTRPAAALRGLTIELWGCGGLGSWIGEFIVRAQAAKIILRDPGQIHGGHLTRQNYTEADVGGAKIEQLADRLNAISDLTIVEIGSRNALDAITNGRLPTCDVLIDATINETVAHHLDQVARTSASGPLLCQVATDRRSATLGLLVIAKPGDQIGPRTIDHATGEQIMVQAEYEDFHDLWRPAVAGTELLPTPGCSTPTYHGSAADIAAVTGPMVSLIGQQIQAPTSGAYLVATPHSGCAPPLTFLSFDHESAS